MNKVYGGSFDMETLENFVTPCYPFAYLILYTLEGVMKWKDLKIRKQLLHALFFLACFFNTVYIKYVAITFKEGY